MAAKTTKSKKTSSAKKKKTTASTQVQEGLYSEIVILISLAVCVLLILSNFGIGGIVGGAVSSVLFGIFGFLAYIMPILLFCGIWFLISNRGNGHAYLKFAAAVLFICMLCTFLELITNSYSVGGFKNITGRNVALNDGLFEVTLIKRPNNPIELNSILTALVSERVDTAYMYCFKTGSLTIESDEEIAWTLDGEYGGNHTKVELSNKQQAVDIIVKE